MKTKLLNTPAAIDENEEEIRDSKTSTMSSRSLSTSELESQS